MKCEMGGADNQTRMRRTPHGVRGLKYTIRRKHMVLQSRTPHGVRGLKYVVEADD